MKLVDAALTYAHNTFSIVPADRITKKPTVNWGQYMKHIADDRSIQGWFTNPRHNLAIICGNVSGSLVVIDFDQVDLFPRWFELVVELAQHLPIVVTGKGYHVYFRMDDPIHNTVLAWTPDKKKLIETRGEGGFVIAPPSIHQNGHIYETTMGAIIDTPVLSANDAQCLLAAARSLSQRDILEDLIDTKPPKRKGITNAYANAALKGEARRVASTPKSRRNDQLNASVWSLSRRFVKNGQLSEHDIFSAMEEACHQNALTRDDGLHSVHATIRSGLKGTQA